MFYLYLWFAQVGISWQLQCYIFNGDSTVKPLLLVVSANAENGVSRMCKVKILCVLYDREIVFFGQFAGVGVEERTVGFEMN